MNFRSPAAWPQARLLPRMGAFLLFLLTASNPLSAGGEPASPDLKNMSDTDLLATVRQLAEQKVGLTKYALPRLEGKAKEFAEHFAAIAEQADTRLNDLAAAGVSTAADPGSPTLPDEVGAVQGLEGFALTKAYVKTMLDLSRRLLSVVEQLEQRTKNTKLQAFGHEYVDAERKQIKDIEALNVEP